jgi:hypothetical protein
MKRHTRKMAWVLLILCTLCFALSPAAATQEYPYHQLAERDMQAVRDAYGNSIRYSFEQGIFPYHVWDDSAEIVQAILAQEDGLKDYVLWIWDSTVIQRILEIQMNSEYTYVFSDQPDDGELAENYRALVAQAGLLASDQFDLSFEALQGDSVMLLLSFHKADTTLACKYIGIVAKADGAAHYYTAETNDMVAEAHPVLGAAVFFCEVMLDSRANIGLIGIEKEDFIRAVNATL